jgi:hypothetical protein
MTATEALRWLGFESQWCRDRDSYEAFCLLLPGILKALDLEAMNGIEASTFKKQLRNRLLETSQKIHAH